MREHSFRLAVPWASCASAARRNSRLVDMPTRTASRALAAPSMVALVKNCTEAPTTGSEAVVRAGVTTGTREDMASLMVRGMSSASSEKAMNVAEETAVYTFHTSFSEGR